MAKFTTNTNHVKQILDAGGLAAIPTETVYGLAANATNTEAVKKIFTTKGRPSNNPLILHFANLEAALPYIQSISDDVKKLTEAFWPGPLTLLLPKSGLVSSIITATSPRVAIRVPDHPLTLELLSKLDYPLAAPSANPSGYISPTKPMHVEQQLGTKIPLILDGGPCSKGLESTILGWNEDEEPILYRQGLITANDISAVIGKNVAFNKPFSNQIEAPGMSKLHYAPHTKTIISASIEEAVTEHEDLKLGVIKAHESYRGKVALAHEVILSPRGSLEEVAEKLYTTMYEFDNLNLDIIIIEEVTNEGIGIAINDRLRRSASENKKSPS